MELSWIDKLRICLVAALGILVIGIACWPLAAPCDPMSPVRSTDLSMTGKVLLTFVAFMVGAVAYFLSWPHGREIGILAVPFGLAVWALRSGPMAVLNQGADTFLRRTALLNSLLVEPLYWLLIAGAGFAGVLAARQLFPAGGSKLTAAKISNYMTSRTAMTILVAVLASIIVSQFFLGALAKDIPSFNGISATQPPVGQIAFAVIAAFAAAAFLIKHFLGLTYILPAVATGFVVPFAHVAYSRGGTVEKFTQIEPATFFANATLAILPLQLVAFGAIGSVVGYWLAIHYRYWRTHLGTE